MLLAGIALVQLRVVAGGFYLDADDWFIVRMGRTVAETPSLDHFLRLWTDEPTWRPLLTALSALEWWLFGPDPLGRYAINVGLHAVCAYLAGQIAQSLTASPKAGLVAAILFAAHPIHAEALAWFHSGFEGVVVTTFVLATVLSVLRGRHGLALLWFQLALFTRENAAALVPLLALVAAWRAGPGHRLRSALRAWPFLVLFLLNVAGRAALVAGGASRPALGSFHLVESPGAALVTTLLHPWFPVHPALGIRSSLWLVFGSFALALMTLMRRTDLRWGFAAIIGALTLSLPFIPVFHEANRFLDADPGGYEQRWYFFHLPTAALVLWPAAVLGRRFTGTRLVVILAPVMGMLLLGQVLNARWWRHQSDVARAMTEAVEAELRSPAARGAARGALAIGVRSTEGADAVELADQVLLNWPVSHPAPTGNAVALFRDRLDDHGRHFERVVVRASGAVVWAPAPRASAQGVVWFEVDESSESLRRSAALRSGE